MGLRINTDVAALLAHTHLKDTSRSLASSMERLSSGRRITAAHDDPAGIGIADKMRAQILGMQQARRNAQDGVGMVQTAEGSLSEIQAILQRVRELGVQYNNGTYGTAERASMRDEVVQLSAEIDRLVQGSNFNGITLLANATPGVLATLQVGQASGDTISVRAVDAGASLGTAVSAFAAATWGTYISLAALDTALDNVSNMRATFGSIENRLQHAVQALDVYEESLTESESRIRDVDFAAETTDLTRLQVLEQSGIAALAQANMQSQSVLMLLQ